MNMMLAVANANDGMTGAIYITAVFVLAVGLLWVNDRLFHRPKRRKQAAVAAKAYGERLANPEVAGLEKHFGRALPATLKALYADPQALARGNFDVIRIGADGQRQSWRIAFYQPLDLQNVGESMAGNEVIEFANDGCGNGFTIDPRVDDPPVMFYDHETGEREKVADNCGEFMEMLHQLQKPK